MNFFPRWIRPISGRTETVVPHPSLALRMTETSWEQIRSELLRPCGREHHLFGILGRSGEAFTVERLLIPRDEDYDVRSAGYVSLSQEFVLRVLRTFESQKGAGLLDLHSHPFQERASFSSTDLTFYGRMLAHVMDRVPGSELVTGVMGTEESGFTLRAHGEFERGGDVHGLKAEAGRLIPQIEVVGRTGTRIIRSWRSAAGDQAPAAERTEGADSWDEAYERNAQIRTEEENRRVAAAKVVIIGAGGIGSEMARQVALLGVRHLTIVDGDRIEQLNLNRLLWASAEDAGRYKVDRLAEELERHDPQRRVHAVRSHFPSSKAVRAVEEADLVLVGVDSDRARFDVLRLCVRHLRPAVDAGTAVYLDEAGERDELRAGHVWLYLPGAQRCWLDMGLDGPGLWDPGLIRARRNAGYVVDEEGGASPGSVQTLNTLMAALAVQAAEQILMGRDPGAEMMQVAVDTSGPMKSSVRSMRIAREPECPLCGENGFEGAGGDPFNLSQQQDEKDPWIPPFPELSFAGDEGATSQEEGSGEPAVPVPVSEEPVPNL